MRGADSWAIKVALHGDTLVVRWDHEGEDDFIAALDKNTGKEPWRQKRSEATAWSSPLIITTDGKSQVVARAIMNHAQ